MVFNLKNHLLTMVDAILPEDTVIHDYDPVTQYIDTLGPDCDRQVQVFKLEQNLAMMWLAMKW